MKKYFFRFMKSFDWQAMRGMTLLDSAIALMVIGLVATPMLQAHKEWKAQHSESETDYKIYSLIKKAMDDFYFQEGRYPCPADPAIGPGSGVYGLEDCNNDGMGAKYIGITPNIIITGSIPFATLKVPESATLDGWSRKMTYAVTEAQTSALPDGTNPGKIIVKQFEKKLTVVEVLDQNNPTDLQKNRTERICTNNIENVSTTAHYVIVSHGEKGVGAYTQEGRRVNECPLGIPGQTSVLEAENCNDDLAFHAPLCARNLQNDDLFYYDDKLVYVDEPPTRIWAISQTNQDDIFSAMPLVGIRTKPEVALDVKGNILIEADPDNPEKTGDALSKSFCINNGQDCFKPTIISGSEPEMDCDNNPTNSGMVGIGKAAALCEATYIPAPGKNRKCPAGEYIKSITLQGDVVCEKPPQIPPP